MTYTLTIEEAKQKLDELVSLLDGNDVILTSNGIPLAKILPISLTNTQGTDLSMSRTEEIHLEQEFENYKHLNQSDNSSQASSEKLVRKAGSSEGLILYMSDDFDAPLDEFKEYGK